jgi:hypothetical protein
MSLEEYEKISITQFKGLYLRGLDDNCPLDHSTLAQNLRYNKNGECSTRDGIVSSLVVSGSNISRMFPATFDHNTTIILTCDGSGKIYRSDTGGVLLSLTNMVDFAAINIFGFCLISPILSGTATSDPVYIWQGVTGGLDTVPIRLAAGVGPGAASLMAAIELYPTPPGNCSVGVHKVAVSFITDTGYTTQPGPMTSPTPPLAENPTFTPVLVTLTGNLSIEIYNIPLGPAGTIARQILLTQADQDLFFYGGGQIWNGSAYVDWDGVIHDNTTTGIIISFFDTDLTVSADALFDLLPSIPGGSLNGSLIASMSSYHNRVFYLGGEFNLVRVTNPGSAESIDNVAGWVQVPDQFDSNYVTNSCTLQDVLYFFKSTGIFSVVDNGGNPNTWSGGIPLTVDAGAGCQSSLGLGTINLSTPANPQNQVAVITDFGGIYLFNGTVVQPPLTWKINDLWTNIYQYTNLVGTRVAIDPYNKLIYITVLGGSGSSLNYNNILVADYNDGLDSQNIKWSVWTFPYYTFPIGDIGMMTFTDGTETAYRFRIAFVNTICKVFPDALNDANGYPIVSLWRSAPISICTGALNIFRFLRARLIYNDNISIKLSSQDGAYFQNLPGFLNPYIPGRDVGREFNFMNESCEVQICCDATNGGFTLQRLDVFGKIRFNMRPSV